MIQSIFEYNHIYVICGNHNYQVFIIYNVFLQLNKIIQLPHFYNLRKICFHTPNVYCGPAASQVVFNLILKIIESSSPLNALKSSAFPIYQISQASINMLLEDSAATMLFPPFSLLNFQFWHTLSPISHLESLRIHFFFILWIINKQKS